MGVREDILACTSFDWDEANLLKNGKKHRVTAAECEQVFFNRPLLARPDADHSQQEARFYVLGQADSGRRLFLVFTIRSRKIRVISVRNMSRKERRSYESHGQENREKES